MYLNSKKRLPEHIKRIVDIVEAVVDRVVLYGSRERFLESAVLLSWQDGPDGKPLGIRKIAKRMGALFDIRQKKAPEKGVDFQSLVAEIYNYQKKMQQEIK